ncbi:MAG TPA: ATP synthase F0 subunit B [Candidatus Limadaptatus stercoravium]|nr:ATP synthase F0 subunit B [Candidatus Limadaptatus stercoravium]
MPLNIDWQQILLHLLNFLILAVGLYLLLYKPVKAFMKKREDSYAEREKKTDEALRSAEKSRSEYEDKLARADEEIADIRKQASAEIETVKAAKLRDAQSEAETIVAAARDKARKEHDRMIAELGSDIRDLVNDMAEKAVMSPGVDDAYEKFLQEAEKEEEDGKD